MLIKRAFMPSSFCKIAAATVIALTLPACGAGRDDNTGQVVASVDGTEITVHQLNAELGRLNITPASDANAAARISTDVLRNLVDQQLLVAQAKEKALDRAPEVVQAIELAKRQILAQAYIKQLASSAKAPDDNELADYYAKHPELFQNRKLYTLHAFVIAKPNLKPGALETLQKSKSLTEAAAFLKTQNIAYQQNTAVHPAEEIPMSVLPKMAGAAPGQVFLLDGATQVTMYDVVSASDQPIALEQAKPIITRFLSNKSNEQRIRDDLNRLRGTAKIAYLGKFADLKPGAAIEAPALDTNQSESKPATAAVSSPSMDRGLSGLK